MDSGVKVDLGVWVVLFVYARETRSELWEIIWNWAGWWVGCFRGCRLASPGPRDAHLLCGPGSL